MVKSADVLQPEQAAMGSKTSIMWCWARPAALGGKSLPAGESQTSGKTRNRAYRNGTMLLVEFG